MTQSIKYTDNIKIISIIGKARYGKSTLINLFATYLMKENQIVTKAKRQVSSITDGIIGNCINVNNTSYLIFDSRGTGKGSTSLDLIYTFYLYMISDILIITEKCSIYSSTFEDNLISAVTLSSLID